MAQRYRGRRSGLRAEGGRLRGRKDHAQLTPLGIVKIQPLQRPKFDHLVCDHRTARAVLKTVEL